MRVLVIPGAGSKRRMLIALAICCVWSITSTRHSQSQSHSHTVVGAFSLPAVTTTKIGSNNIIGSNDGNRRRIRQKTRISSLNNSDEDDVNANTNANASVWSPDLRRVVAGIAGVGALETGYLTYAKLFSDATTNGALLFCGSSSNSYSSCDRVLNGPYSNLPFFESVPLASLGFLAYGSVVVLALLPLFGGNDDTNDNDGDDTNNRIALTALTTSMATFSIFLMTLLFGVLQTSCPYCVVSATCSFLLANIALIGGCLPERTEIESTAAAANGGKTVFAGFAGAVVGAVLLFGAGSIDSINNSFGGSTSTLVATINGQSASTSTSTSTASEKVMLYAPPTITTDSSERALALGRELQALGGARMYGAHWCSHCYDQKQTLGKQVFGDKGFVEYVECSSDGVRSQSKVCKAKEIPGYPTWEIQGKLYPGEQELDELEDLVKGLKEGSTTTTAASVATTN
mmetsp:Transcript_21310/g.46535  ORF Transcript_21310/g.46535 Transcript_21310/m.46535 type:complete len:459 (+) Transcript_21310:268-1644(+)